MTPTHPLATRYVDALNRTLGDVASGERAEILNEIRNHIADATNAGTPVEDVLAALGPAEQLARAYRVELLLNPKTPAPRVGRWLKILALLAFGSLPTFIIAVTLGAIGVSFSASGIFAFVAGLVAAAGSLPPGMVMDVPPWVALALGPALTVFGIAALWALVAYLRFLVRVVRRLVPTHQAA